PRRSRRGCASPRAHPPTGLTPTGRGGGAPRLIDGSLINQGSVTVDGDTFLDLNATVYTSAGGTVTGPHQFRNSQIRETAAASSPTTLVLRQGNNALLTDNLPNTTLWVQGEFSNGDATLTLATNVPNHGTILLQTLNSGTASNLNANGFTLTNAADGLLDVERGGGGPRTLFGNFVNAGALKLGGNVTLVNELSGGATETL